jgi:hypothetical protein
VLLITRMLRNPITERRTWKRAGLMEANSIVLRV